MNSYEQTIKYLTPVTDNPCVTISLNTHRTHPDNARDAVMIKNLFREAEQRLLKEFDKNNIGKLLERMSRAVEACTHEHRINQHLDSLHIFLSDSVYEVVKSIWPVHAEGVHISSRFALRPLVLASGRHTDYLVMTLSQSGVRLYEATNDTITGEIENDDFPVPDTEHYLTTEQQKSDPKKVDDMVRTYLNKVDKALLKLHHQNGKQCVVVCTGDNYSRLMQVADKPGLYIGNVAIDYNNTTENKIAADAWALVLQQIHQQEDKYISNLVEAAGNGRVYTDMQDVYRMINEGNCDTLIVDENFSQPALISDAGLELTTRVNVPGTVDDIAGHMAAEAMAKNGKVVFAAGEKMKPLGNIALKTRY